MEMGWLFFASICGILLGIILFFGGISDFRRKRLIENIPTSTVRSLAMGLVEVSGNVLPASDKILKSPLTNKDCVYYWYTVEEFVNTNKGGHWDQVKNGSESVPFLLKDSTGAVLVDPKKANISVSKSFEFESYPGKELPSALQDFLKRADAEEKKELGSLSFIFSGLEKRRLRFTEKAIFINDQLFVLGTASDNPQVEDSVTQGSTSNKVIQKDNNTFFISNSSEKQILSSLGKKSPLLIGGGSILIVGFLYLMMFGLNLL